MVYNLKAQTQKAIPALYLVGKFCIFVLFQNNLYKWGTEKNDNYDFVPVTKASLTHDVYF